jgi:hypothetical protein
MAGVYFRISSSETTLSGYIRAGGNLSVLGLIHASVEFLLMVTYQKRGDRSVLYGSCTITISIDLFMFSMDVDITMEKTIAGSSSSDPARTFQNASGNWLNHPLDRKLAGSSRKLMDDGLPSGSTPVTNDLPRPYITRHQNASGQFKDTSTWLTSYWNHFAN